MIYYGLLSALGELVYVSLVVMFFNFGDRIGLNEDQIIAPAIILMLLVFSVIMSGFIVLAYPALLFVRGKAKPALEMLGWTALFMFIAIIIGILMAIGF